MSNYPRRGFSAAALAVLSVGLVTGSMMFVTDSASAHPTASANVITASDTTSPTPTDSTSSTPVDTTPVANTESFKIWPGHWYNFTDKVLKNDDGKGCTLQIANAVQNGGLTTAQVHFSDSTHQLKVKSFKRTSKPLSVTFDYTAQCVEDNSVTTNTATDTVTVRPTFLVRMKLLSGHRYKLINRNSTYVLIHDWARHSLITKYRIPAHSSKIKKRPHVFNMWEAKLGKFKLPDGEGFLNPW
jgi:hypothetical protein